MHKLFSLQRHSDEANLLFFKTFRGLSKYIDFFESDIQKNLRITESLLADADIIESIKKSLDKSKYQLVKPLTSHIKKLEAEMTVLRKDNQKLTEKSEGLEMKIFNFTQEIEKHRRNTKLSLLFSDPNERICGLCQKVYKPISNFNWSCRHHKARIVNDVWFCCGKLGKAAEGCLVSKHISNEEIEELERDDVKKTFCINCRNKDHQTSQCPYDPNIRSQHNPSSELIRLKNNDLRKLQTRSKVQKYDLLCASLSRSRKGHIFAADDSDISDFDVEDIIK